MMPQLVASSGERLKTPRSMPIVANCEPPPTTGNCNTPPTTLAAVSRRTSESVICESRWMEYARVTAR